MKKIPLTQGEVALVDDKDYEPLMKFQWSVYGGTREYEKTKYALRRGVRPDGGQTTVKMHRQILGLTNQDEHVDHINGNGLDNRRSNLRIVTRSANLHNTPAYRNNRLGIKGVFYKRDRRVFVAKVMEHRVPKTLYSGPDLFEAVCARKSWEAHYHKGD
jgi:hypothetical protein